MLDECKYFNFFKVNKIIIIKFNMDNYNLFVLKEVFLVFIKFSDLKGSISLFFKKFEDWGVDI